MEESKDYSEHPEISDLAKLLSKVEIELDNGKMHKFNTKEVARAKECLHKNGKVLISFKKPVFDGPDGGGTGTGTGID